MQNRTCKKIFAACGILSLLLVALPSHYSQSVPGVTSEYSHPKETDAATPCASKCSVNEKTSESLTSREYNDEKNKNVTSQQDRVITQSTTEIIEEQTCECENPIVLEGGGFPAYALLGIPGGFLLFGVLGGTSNNELPPPSAGPAVSTMLP